MRKPKTKAAKSDPKVPSVLLAGKEWPVPKLVVRQLREVRGPLIEMNNRFGEAAKASRSVFDVFGSLSRDEYDALVLRPIYHALTRATPDLEYEEFLDMEIEDGEIVAAWFVAREQSGVFVKKKAEDDALGEAKAARKSQTGM